MNKKLKIFLLTFLALVVVGGGYILYIFQFKEYEVADEEVDEIIDNPYDIVLPNGTTLVIDDEETTDGEKNDKDTVKDNEKSKDNGKAKDNEKATDQQTTGVSSSNGSGDTTGSTSTAGSNSGTTVDGTVTSGNGQSADKQASDGKQPNKENTTSTSGDKSASNQASGDKPAADKPVANKPATGNTGSGNPDKKDSVATIKGKYQPTVNSLQGQVDGKINSLIGRAKTEYSTKKANGESVNYAYFYNKYMSAAEGLEAQTDAVFRGVVNSLEKDLQANGYDKSYSKSVTDEYEAQKKARRDSIMKKAMSN